MPVCNQTWLKDALCWPAQYSKVKGHVSRSKGQMRSNVKVYLQDSIRVDNLISNRMPVCNQTCLVDALDWLP